MFKELMYYAWRMFGAWLFLIPLSMVAWITHIVWCIQNREFLFMIAAGIVAPVGAIHGFCLWFGITWI
jgi:hypothetical protein